MILHQKVNRGLYKSEIHAEQPMQEVLGSSLWYALCPSSRDFLNSLTLEKESTTLMIRYRQTNEEHPRYVVELHLLTRTSSHLCSYIPACHLNRFTPGRSTQRAQSRTSDKPPAKRRKVATVKRESANFHLAETHHFVGSFPSFPPHPPGPWTVVHWNPTDVIRSASRIG